MHQGLGGGNGASVLSQKDAVPWVPDSFCERVVLGKGAKILLAEVHREFVHHIVEDEVDGQEERQDDRREDSQQRKENGEVEENQTHNMSA